MKGGILRKIKSISTFTSLKHNLVFQVNGPTQYFQTAKQENDSDMFSQNITSSDLTKDVHEVQSLAQTQEPDTMEKELSDFDEKCPPGGKDAVVFYTTSLRGIRKTFEDCSIIRYLLESFGVVYYERDVSMHVEYREELWRTLGGGRVVPPRLFIRGKHIGGADEVVGLHEQGMLKKLLHGIPLLPSTSPCKGCCGIRFVLCLSCHGSCKITDPANEYPTQCPECNENGLIKCPICS